MHTHRTCYLLMVLVLLGPSVCFSREVLPYWEAEVFHDRIYDPNALMEARELVAPNDGRYTLFTHYDLMHERYKDMKDVYEKVSPEEREVLVELQEELDGKGSMECKPHIYVHLSGSGNDRGFHPVEGVFIRNQGFPDELFVRYYYSCIMRSEESRVGKEC